MLDHLLTSLTAAQRCQLDNLVALCQENEPITLCLPEDAIYYLFVCNEENLPVCCLAVCEAQENLWECYAFTRPDCRRRGLFTHLLEKVCHLAEEKEKEGDSENIDIVFLTDQKSPDALSAAKAMGMELWYMEYRMKLEKSFLLLSDVQEQDIILSRKTIEEEGIRTWLYLAFSAAQTSSPLGSCRILPYDCSRFYLHHLEIKKENRGKGWGKKLLRAVLLSLPSNWTVTLQVSSDNLAAVNLYKKTGFQVDETLSYFFY